MLDIVNIWKQFFILPAKQITPALQIVHELLSETAPYVPGGQIVHVS